MGLQDMLGDGAEDVSGLYDKPNILYEHCETIARLHSPLKGRCVLDIGGCPQASLFLENGARRYVCVNESPAAIAKFREKFPDNNTTRSYCMNADEIKAAIDYGRADNSLASLSIKEQDFGVMSYDRINMSWLPTRLDNKELGALLKNLYLMLQPNGFLVLTAPHPVMGIAQHNDYFKARTLADYVKIPSSAGFSLVDMLEIESKPGDPLAKDVKFPEGTSYPSRLIMKWTRKYY